MADVTLTYNGQNILEMSASGTKTLKAAGKICKTDIEVAYVKSGGVPLLSRAEWNALTTAQKQAYGLVAVQDENYGYMRGDLLNGADYIPFILRTNYAQAKYELTNWTVRYDDDWELTFRHFSNPASRGNWPIFISDIRENGDFLIQHNFWNGRKVINFGWNGHWTGDANISYETPYDYSGALYTARKSGDKFSILKSGVVFAEQTMSGASENTSHPYNAFLFSDNAQKTLDTGLYEFKIWNAGGTLIHDYIGGEANGTVGLIDRADNNLFIAPSASGHTLVSNP